MNKDEALKLALEALLWANKEINGWRDDIRALEPIDHPEIMSAIIAIKEALEQPEQEPKCNPHPKAPHGFNRNASHANDRYTCECESWDAYEAGRLDGIAQEQAMYEVQRLGQEIQPEQEPVAWRNAAIRVGEDLCSVGPFGYYDMTAEQWLNWALSVVTVHAPPPQRKPLTDEQIMANDVLRYHFALNGGAGPISKQGRKVIDAIEAAQGIKE